MKLIALLVIASLVQVSASTFGQQMTLKDNNATYEQVFREIRRQTGYDVLMENTRFDTKRRVRMHFEEAPLKEVLNYLVQGTGLTYVINETAIVFKEKPVLEKVQDFFSEEEEVRQLTVRGKVTDTLGAPLPGVTVRVLGTSNGALTDKGGRYVLEGVAEDAVLQFTMVGFEGQEVPVNGRAVVDVVLEVSLSALDEVQVIAYGTTTRRLSTGNVSTVKAEDIEKQPVSNPLLALQGRVPGLLIEQATGLPGSGVEVRIQGRNSINRGTDPLYVIDGVPFFSQLLPNLSGVLGSSGQATDQYGNPLSGNPLSFINPLDILSIDILKDADATAIYGSRGANGVILITTKRGRAGKLKIDMNLQSGVADVANKLDLLNTQQYIEMRREAYLNDGLPIPSGETPHDYSNYDLTVWEEDRYTDWQERLIGGTAQYQNVQLAVSGGNVQTQFLASGTYHKETTVFPGDLFNKKGSFNLNISTASEDQRFKFQTGVIYQLDDNNLINWDYTSDAVKLAPNAPALHIADGTLNWAQYNGNSTWKNPLSISKNYFKNRTSNLIVNATVLYKILSGLSFKFPVGYVKLQSEQYTQSPLTSFAPEIRSTQFNQSTFSNSSATNWQLEPQISYHRNIFQGTLNILVGGALHGNNKELTGARGFGFSSDLLLNNLSLAAYQFAMPPISTEYKYSALFSRVNYNLLDRYIISLNWRRDGSSRFGAKNQFHNFSSIGTAWIISKEKFFGSISIISFAKLSASYGSTGSDQIGDYQYLDLYNPVNQNSYQGIIAIASNRLENYYLQWEETKKLSTSIDLGFLEDKFLFNLTYYRNQSTNQLMNYRLPVITGFTGIVKNFPAVILNTGLEFSLTSINFSSNSFKWTTDFSLTIPHNKVVDFPNVESTGYASGDNGIIVGQPIGVRKAFKYIGVDPNSGIYQFLTANGELTSDPNYFEDRISIVNDNFPTYFGGLFNRIIFKGFELAFLFQFTKQVGIGYYGSNPGRFFGDYSQGVGNIPLFMLDRWREKGDKESFQRYSAVYSPEVQNAYNAYGGSDAIYEDASFIRLKNLSFSYLFPRLWTERRGVHTARIFVQGQNLLTITRYKGLDPETKSSLSLPPLRVFTVGLKVSL